MLQSFSNEVNNPKIAIIVTDGASFEPYETRKAAMEAKMAGIVMFAIGVGDDVNPQETSAISSDPDRRYLFQVTDFQALESIGDQFHGRNCSEFKYSKQILLPFFILVPFFIFSFGSFSFQSSL